MEEKVTVKSKNLDVLAEYNKSTRKKSANFVVIGGFDIFVCWGDGDVADTRQDMWMPERVHLWGGCWRIKERSINAR